MTTKITLEDGNLIATRVFSAPREAVFEAWVETQKVEKWWGCAQTTNVRAEIEPKVGGKYCMHMTLEGVGEMPGAGELIEFDPPAKLAYTAPAGVGDAVMTVTVTFTEQEGGTEVRLVHEGIPEEFKGFVHDGWTAAFGKLNDFLAAEV